MTRWKKPKRKHRKEKPLTFSLALAHNCQRDVLRFVSIRPELSVCYLFKFIFFNTIPTHICDWLSCTHSQRRLWLCSLCTLWKVISHKKSVCEQEKGRDRDREHLYNHRAEPTNAFAISDIFDYFDYWINNAFGVFPQPSFSSTSSSSSFLCCLSILFM